MTIEDKTNEYRDLSAAFLSAEVVRNEAVKEADRIRDQDQAAIRAQQTKIAADLLAVGIDAPGNVYATDFAALTDAELHELRHSITRDLELTSLCDHSWPGPHRAARRQAERALAWVERETETRSAVAERDVRKLIVLAVPRTANARHWEAVMSLLDDGGDVEIDSVLELARTLVRCRGPLTDTARAALVRIKPLLDKRGL